MKPTLEELHELCDNALKLLREAEEESIKLDERIEKHKAEVKRLKYLEHLLRKTVHAYQTDKTLPMDIILDIGEALKEAHNGTPSE